MTTQTAAPPNIEFDYQEQVVDHDPALYNAAQTVPTIKTLDDVDDDAVAFYREHGYLAVEQALNPDEVAHSIQVLDDLITGKRTGHNTTMYERAAQEAGIENLTDDQKRAYVRKLAFFADTASQTGLPTDHPGMTRVVRKLMGGRTPEPAQIMTLLKPARGGREKPWHQDHAYFNYDVADPIVGIWIALDEATIANGCMHLIDGGHKLGPIHHWKRRDWQICDSEVMGKPSLAAPFKPGGALFFGSLLPHGTPTNHSPDSRRAMQFHYRPVDHKPITQEARMEIFGTEGKDVQC